MHFFTSISQNYLPKARVLAKSVKKYCKDSYFSLVLSDDMPERFDLAKEPFDELVHISKLNIPVKNLEQWIFGHDVVEICTAVKGQAMLNFLRAGRSDKVVYLDPDTVVFDDLSELESLLDEHDVVLTPHITKPEAETKAIWDNEVACLMHGIFNLGFLAVRKSDRGLAFVTWWRDRLRDFCMKDIPHGIFTDQSWVDLAPVLFDGIYILRKPNYNVATWNINRRQVTEQDGKYFVDGLPLQFYHFSGFDSGGQEVMLKRYGHDNPALYQLREWYIQAMDANGQQELGRKEIAYARYDNGEVIRREHRLVMRTDAGVQKQFPHPFRTSGKNTFYQWINLPENKYRGMEDERDARIQLLEEDLALHKAAVAKYRKVLAPLIFVKHLIKK